MQILFSARNRFLLGSIRSAIPSNSKYYINYNFHSFYVESTMFTVVGGKLFYFPFPHLLLNNFSNKQPYNTSPQQQHFSCFAYRSWLLIKEMLKVVSIESTFLSYLQYFIERHRSCKLLLRRKKCPRICLVLRQPITGGDKKCLPCQKKTSHNISGLAAIALFRSGDWQDKPTIFHFWPSQIERENQGFPAFV
jgi:hypothetical protein